MTPGSVSGDEIDDNRHILYQSRSKGALAGTCLLTVAKAAPTLGGLGGVATDPPFRGRGISTALCGQSVEEFRKDGGKALFLGTHNPAAGRVYYRLGWRRLAGSNVMANISSGDLPESFLTDYFRPSASATVGPATPADRLPMVPLLLSPHDWQVMDANAAIFSTRHRLQPSCMGLYPKYMEAVGGPNGTWFSARTGDGRVVGLGTARLDGNGGCQVDGFTHKYHPESWESLIRAAMQWGADARGASKCWAEVSAEDEEKQALFESMGFSRAGSGNGFDLDGRTVGSMRLEQTS